MGISRELRKNEVEKMYLKTKAKARQFYACNSIIKQKNNFILESILSTREIMNIPIANGYFGEVISNDW